MRAVIQRAREARCQVEEKIVGSIKKGIVVFLAVGKEDKLADVEYLAEKIVNLRIFPDEKGKMNLSLLQVGGDVLTIPQFTLYGNCEKGLRPNFIEAAGPDLARKYYLKFLELIKRKVATVEGGKFGERMRVAVDNEGPVTLILDSKKWQR